MTAGEKDRFCAFAASLFASPDAALLEDLRRGELRPLLDGYVRLWGGDVDLSLFSIRGSGGEEFLAALQGDYARLFGQWEGEKISLVESTYKPWTGDKGCGMVFAASTGLVMGDCALHMRELYRQASLEVSKEFRSMPDHLVLELEFLAFLYRFGSDEQVRQFVGDHLDWIPALREALEKADPHPFYRRAVELVCLFLHHEVNREGDEDHVQKEIR